MTLTTADIFALFIALFGLNTVLILAFRRIYVLEKQVLTLRRKLREAK
jgi:hypothetical protein